MVQMVAFRDAKGYIGFFQKDGDSVVYYADTENILMKLSGSASWSSWMEQLEADNSDNKEKISKEAIKFFVRDFLEDASLDIVEMTEVQRPGSFYPRIFRENIYFNYVGEQYLQDARAYQNIQSSLDLVFNYIEPSTVNLGVYGHKIRELLILACTEVEYLLVKFLTENGYEKKDRYSTKDYVKCKDILGLDKFEVGLVQYPNLKVFKPFETWTVNSPTKTLPWYSAYNAVKHNRSDNIADANLEHLLDALSAIHVLLESQYGKDIFEGWISKTEDRSMYKTVDRPTWRCDEIFAPLLVDGKNVEVKWTNQRKYFEDHTL